MVYSGKTKEITVTPVENTRMYSFVSSPGETVPDRRAEIQRAGDQILGAHRQLRQRQYADHGQYPVNDLPARSAWWMRSEPPMMMQTQGGVLVAVMTMLSMQTGCYRTWRHGSAALPALTADGLFF